MEGENNVENKKIYILGMARIGYEVAKLLSQRKNKVLITYTQEQDEDKVNELKSLGVEYAVLTSQEELLDETFDYVIRNPGISFEHPCVLKAQKLGIPVTNEIEVAYHFLPKDVTIIGITGSNGKTTTTTLIYEFLHAMGKSVYLGGNIGYPLSSLVNKIKSGDILVLEISAQQLYDCVDFKTNIGVLTNLSEVHLDSFKTYDNYKKVKAHIFKYHTANELAILNLGNADVLEITKKIKSRKIYFLVS